MSLTFYLTVGVLSVLMLGAGVFAAIQGLRHIAQQNDSSVKARHS